MKIFLPLIIASLAVSAHGAGDYIVEELRELSKSKPFSITQVEPIPGGLRLFIQSSDIDAIPKLLRNGSLAAQLSDGDSETIVPLSLGKRVRCDGETFHIGYSDPLPDCVVEQIRYFLKTPVVLGPGRDLAIGLDPDCLWLIEER